MSGELDFSVRLEIENLKRDVLRVQNEFAKLSNKAEAEGARIDQTFKRVGAGLVAYFSVDQLFSLGKAIATTRGEFQQLEVAFNTMLGSKDKADQLMGQVTELAATTPFQLKEVASGAKQLLAYGEASEDVTKTLTQLGDIASGLSIPLNDIVYLYGTTRTQGRLYTQDLNQFLGRGIPLVKMLAKQFNVAESEVKKLVEQGKVGFPQVKKAIDDLTGSGGMFNNLMAAQSKTITGQLSNLADAWDNMLNEIGQNNEGFIGGTIDALKYLVENYKDVIKILGVLVTTYGAYKAAVMATYVVQKAQAIMSNVKAWFELARGIKTAKDAQILFNMASKANPWGLLAAAIAAVVSALVMFGKKTDAIKSSMASFNEELAKEQKALNDSFEALKSTNEGSDERKELIGKINEVYGIYLENLLTEKSSIDEIAAAQKYANDALMRNIALKHQANAIEEVSKKYDLLRAKRVSEIQELIREKDASKMKEASDELEKLIKRAEELGTTDSQIFSKEVYEFTKKYVGSSAWRTIYERSSDIQSSIYDITKAHKDQQEQVKKVEDSYYSYTKKAKSAYEIELDELKKQLADKIISEKDYLVKLEELNKKYGKKTAPKTPPVSPTSDTKDKKDYANQIKQQKDELEKSYKDMWYSARQAEIDAMNEGLDKVLAQADLNYKKELDQIEQQKKERLLKLQELEKLEFIKKGGKESKFVPTTTQLPEADIANFDALQKTAKVIYSRAISEAIKADDEMIFAEKEKLLKMAQEFETFQQKRLRIAQEYDKKISELEKNNTNNQLNENIIEAKQQKNDALAEIDKEIASREASFIIWSDRLTGMGLEKLLRALKIAKDTLEKGGLSETEKSVWRAKIAVLEDKIKMEKAYDDANKNMSFSEKWGDTLAIMGEINQTVEGIINNFENLGETQQEVLRGAINIGKGIITIISNVQDLAKTGSGALSGIAKSIASLGIIGAAISIISAGFKIYKREKLEEAEMEKKVLGLIVEREIRQREYNILLREQAVLAKEAANAFGKDSIAGTVAVMERMIDATKEYNEIVNKGNPAYDNNLTMLETFAIHFPEIVDEAGNLNIEYAKLVVNSSGLTDSARAWLQSLIDISGEINSANEYLESYIENTFGALGDDLLNSIQNALEQGVDAWEDFGKAGADVLETLGKQIAYSLFFSDAFSQLQDSLKEVYGSGQSAEQIGTDAANIIQSFYTGIKGQMQNAQDFLQQWDEQIGTFDLWNNSSTQSTRQATSKGFASMSQDSADELNGRFTALQGFTYEINNSVKLLVGNSSQILNMLGGIRDNTDYCRRLESIEADMSSVKAGIDIINTRGIVLR